MPEEDHPAVSEPNWETRKSRFDAIVMTFVLVASVVAQIPSSIATARLPGRSSTSPKVVVVDANTCGWIDCQTAAECIVKHSLRQLQHARTCTWALQLLTG